MAGNEGRYDRRERLNIFKDIRAPTHRSSSPKEARGYRGAIRHSPGTAGDRRVPPRTAGYCLAGAAEMIFNGFKRAP